jgi:hypothetical protein
MTYSPGGCGCGGARRGRASDLSAARTRRTGLHRPTGDTTTTPEPQPAEPQPVPQPA